MGLDYEMAKNVVVGTWDIDKGATISKGSLDKEDSADVEAFDGYIEVTKTEVKFLGGSGKEPKYKYKLKAFTDTDAEVLDNKYDINTMVDGKPVMQGDFKILDNNSIVYTDYKFPYPIYLVRRS